ncbi:MAG: hypothetical protein J7J36_05125 [Thermoplasmata archaeon]|nr:hypothetical protein [Thermoplasmata archaeon]
MRKAIAIMLMSMFLFGASLAGINNVKEIAKNTAQNVIEKTYTFSPPEVKSEGNYLIVSANNAQATMREGYPIMPYKVAIFHFPAGTKVAVKSSIGNVNEMKLDKKIAPYPTLTLLNSNEKPVIKEGDVYSKGEIYPEKWVEWRATVGLYNGKHVVTLSVFSYPYRYDTKENKLIYTDKIN